MNKSTLYYLISLIVSFNSLRAQPTKATNNIINYDYTTGAFDKQYLYFKQNFTLKGDAKFSNLNFDSVRVYIYKTRQDDPQTINKVLLSPVNFASKRGKTVPVNDEDGVLKAGKNTLSAADISTLDQTKVVDELTFSGRWYRPNKDAALFSIAVNQNLDFNWVYAVRLVFWPSVTGTITSSQRTSTILTGQATQYSKEIADSPKKLEYTDPITGVKTESLVTTTAKDANDVEIITVVTNTLQSIAQASIDSGLSFLRAYDDETLESRFAATTGFGGVFLRSNAGNADGEFLNFVGLRFHLGRVFPNYENPYFVTWYSRISIGVGMLTTTMKYKETTLQGFGDKATLKPVFFGSVDFNKYFGISVGLVAFKQASGLSTSTMKTIGVAPFFTLHASAELIGLFSQSSNLPKANNN